MIASVHGCLRRVSSARRFRAGAAIALAALLLLTSLADAGERRRAGNVVFTLPDGWEAAELERGPDDRPVTVLRPEDWLRNDEAVSIWLPRGAPMPGNEAALRTWAQDTIAATLQLDADERLDLSEWGTIGSGESDAPLLGSLFVTDTGSGRRKTAVIAVLTRAGGRAEIAYVTVSNRGDADALRDAFRRSATTLVTTVSGFAYLSAGAAPLLAPPSPGPLDGVWWGVELVMLPGLDGMLTSQLHEHLYVFRSDGRFFDGIPPGGVDAMDDPDVALLHTSETGHYRMRGETLLLAYASGKRDELTVDGPLLQDGAALLRKVRLPADGFRFAASRDSVQHTSLAAGIGESASVSSANTLTFRSDGTFGRDGFVSATGQFEAGGYHVKRDADARGTYTVEGGEIALRYADGRDVRWPILIEESGEDGPTLWIGGRPAELMDGFVLPTAGEAVR